MERGLLCSKLFHFSCTPTFRDRSAEKFDQNGNVGAKYELGLIRQKLLILVNGVVWESLETCCFKNATLHCNLMKYVDLQKSLSWNILEWLHRVISNSCVWFVFEWSHDWRQHLRTDPTNDLISDQNGDVGAVLHCCDVLYLYLYAESWSWLSARESNQSAPVTGSAFHSNITEPPRFATLSNHLDINLNAISGPFQSQ